jgi:integrase
MNNYKIRKRVPKVLVPILNCKEIYRTFKTQLEVDTLNALLEECTAIVNSTLPLEITTPIVLDKGLEQYRKQPRDTETKVLNLEDATALYLAHSKGNVTKVEYKNRVDFFTKLLPALFNQYKLKFSELKASDMQTLSNAILELPNRKYYKYRTLPIDEFVSLKVSSNERQKVDSCNKQIKRIRGLALYGEATGLYSMPTKIATHKEPHNDVGYREALSKEEYLQLRESITDKKKLILDVVYYSGLRPSEICKAKISTIDGVLCFDLKSSKEGLKTHSSYRYVPIHSKLIPHIEHIQELTYSTIKQRARGIKINGKTLYSARHSFVTNLINLGVSPERVSELVGHAHRTMTMGTYFAGYSMDQLKADIELL